MRMEKKKSSVNPFFWADQIGINHTADTDKQIEDQQANFRVQSFDPYNRDILARDTAGPSNYLANMNLRRHK